MSTQWAQVFCVRGSVYALNTDTKTWEHRGTSGDIIMFQNPLNHSDIQLKFERDIQQLYWRLTSSKLKPKGDRALVLKAWSSATREEEIIAIRFIDQSSCILFAKKYLMFQRYMSLHQVIQVPKPPINYARPPPPPQPRRVPPHAPPRFNSQQNIFNSHYQRMPDLQLLPNQPQISQQMAKSVSINVKQPTYYRPYAYSEPIKPEYTWKCGVCTYQNQQSWSACSMCASPKRIEPTNDIDEELYEDPSNPGGIQLPQPIYIPHNNPQLRNTVHHHANIKWKCSACTFSNDPFVERCDICSAKKPQQYTHQEVVNPVQSPIYNVIPPHKYAVNTPNESSWNCPTCTLLNDASRARCDACNTAQSMYSYPDLMNIGMTLDISIEAKQSDDEQMCGSTVQDFARIASDIAYYNHKKAISVFCTLRSVTKRSLNEEDRYRTLDTTNPKVMKSLLGFKGVLDFLALLGFQSDAIGMKLILEKKPTEQLVDNALTALNSCIHQLKEKENIQEEHKTDDGVDPFVNDNSHNTEQKVDLLTLEQIILWATHENMRNNDTMRTLIMTHKLFTESLTFMKQLRKRFLVPIPPDIINTQNQRIRTQLIQEFQNNVQKPIQLKVINALRDWIKRYWSEDFHKNEAIQCELESWLKELSVYDRLDNMNSNCVWISKAYVLVYTEYVRQQRINWDFKLQQQMNISSSLFQDVDVGDQKEINECLGKLTADELADQITLLNYALFSRIQPRECTGQRWKDKNNKQLAPNILSLIQQFNNFSIFIQIQILREKSVKKRGTAIKRIIKMGQRFQASRNYNSLYSVFVALYSAPINRLKLAWNRAPERYRTVFQGWRQIFSRDHNYRNLRQLTKKAGGNSCIPHIGIFLQDLLGLDEGNKKKIAIAAFNGNQMLNFNKCVRISERINDLLSFQHHNCYSNIQKNEKIQKILLIEFDELKSITEDQLWEMSTDVKKADERESKQLLPFLRIN